jgi:hypothetical protein
MTGCVLFLKEIYATKRPKIIWGDCSKRSPATTFIQSTKLNKRLVRLFFAVCPRPESAYSSVLAHSGRQKKGNPPAAKMQPAGLDLYPLPQGRLHKSTSNELWQDHGDHIVAVDGSVRQFSGGWHSVTSSVCRW